MAAGGTMLPTRRDRISATRFTWGARFLRSTPPTGDRQWLDRAAATADFIIKHFQPANAGAAGIPTTVSVGRRPGRPEAGIRRKCRRRALRESPRPLHGQPRIPQPCRVRHALPHHAGDRAQAPRIRGRAAPCRFGNELGAAPHRDRCLKGRLLLREKSLRIRRPLPRRLQTNRMAGTRSNLHSTKACPIRVRTGRPLTSARE